MAKGEVSAEAEASEACLPIGVGREGPGGHMQEWSYGYGEEGVLGETRGGQVMCFGSAFPWWGSVASMLGLERVNLVVTKVNSP